MTETLVSDVRFGTVGLHSTFVVDGSGFEFDALRADMVLFILNDQVVERSVRVHVICRVIFGYV